MLHIWLIMPPAAHFCVHYKSMPSISFSIQQNKNQLVSNLFFPHECMVSAPPVPSLQYVVIKWSQEKEVLGPEF